MELKKIIRSVELFEGLTDDELGLIGAICKERTFAKGDLLAVKGEIGNNLFIVIKGVVEILVEGKHNSNRVIANLGAGQLIGEMSLVDRGPRSATVRAIHNPTIVEVIEHQEFLSLCELNNRIGYIVMHNLAADLSFKLRHRHLSEI
jgi:CRP/FNR family cyclic AMP-dependent transcriptional regulator